MANSVIISLNANSYTGQFSYNGASGNFNTDSQKNLNSINGTKEGVGSFDAYGMGEQMNYNLHPTSLEKASELAILAGEAVDAVQAELLN